MSHSRAPLPPTAAAAATLPQLEAHAKEQAGAQPGLRIVGYYQANERLDDGDLGAGRRYADRIDAAYPQSVALLVSGGRARGHTRRGRECCLCRAVLS